MGHILVPAEHGEPQGLDLAHPRPRHGQHQVEVVDHQVEHHADVRGAEGEGAAAHGFDVLRIGQVGKNGVDCRVEALDVPDLQDDAAVLGGADQLIGLHRGGAERFFHEQVHAPAEQFQGHGMMEAGRRGDDGGVDLTHQRPMVGQGLRAAFGGELAAARLDRVHDGSQLDVGHSGQLLGVKPAQSSSPDHRDTKRAHRSVPGPWLALPATVHKAGRKGVGSWSDAVALLLLSLRAWKAMRATRAEVSPPNPDPLTPPQAALLKRSRPRPWRPWCCSSTKFKRCSTSGHNWPLERRMSRA